MLIEELLEPGDVPVAFGTGHGWDEVVDESGVGAAFRLGALSRVIDEEGIDQGKVADGLVGAGVWSESDGLTGQPLHVAVFTDVDDRVGPEAVTVRGAADPLIGCEVVVVRSQVGVVVDADGVVAKSARWLHHHDDVPEA